jgi:hypothetical protein
LGRRGVVSRGVERLVVQRMISGKDREGGKDTAERVRRTRGRDAEWFDVIWDIGEGELVKGIEELGSGGLGVECVFNDETSTASTVSKAGLTVRSMTYRTHPATFEPTLILFYTALIASLTNIAHELSLPELLDWLEEYRSTAPNLPPSDSPGPMSELEYLAKALRITPTYPRFLPQDEQIQDDVIANPFFALTTYMDKDFARQRANIPMFIQRYEEAGGFRPTSAEKLDALVEAEEARRRGRKSGKKIWKSGIERWVDECVDIDESWVETSKVAGTKD